MNRTNYHLTIKNNNQDYYFYDEFLTTGDIVRIGGYRTVVVHIDSRLSCYIELTAILINEGEKIIKRENLR